MNIANDDILIDPEFAQKIPPLTAEEFDLLEQNILNEGKVINPLIIWKGTLIDGHNRYRVIREHPEISYSVYEKNFADRYEAIAYICKNQLGRRNLSPEQKKYLIGKQYEAEKASHGGSVSRDRDEEGKFASSYQNDNLRSETNLKTCERIAHENNIGSATVLRAEKFAIGLDAAEEALPGIREEVLSGQIRPTERAVTAIAKAEPEEREELARQLRSTKAKKGATLSNEFEAESKSEMTEVDPDPDMSEADQDEDEDPHPVFATSASHNDIKQISDALLHSDGIACGTEDDMISEMNDALSELIWRWNNCQETYAAHLKHRSGREKVKELADEGMEYFKKIKKGALWK